MQRQQTRLSVGRQKHSLLQHKGSATPHTNDNEPYFALLFVYPVLSDIMATWCYAHFTDVTPPYV